MTIESDYNLVDLKASYTTIYGATLLLLHKGKPIYGNSTIELRNMTVPMHCMHAADQQ